MRRHGKPERLLHRMPQRNKLHPEENQNQPTIREKEYTFEITAAFCNKCGGEMEIPGLMDYNMKEIDEQYRSIRT